MQISRKTNLVCVDLTMKWMSKIKTLRSLQSCRINRFDIYYVHQGLSISLLVLLLNILKNCKYHLPGWQCQFRNVCINHWPSSRHWCLRAEGARVIYCRNSSSYQPSPSGNINIHLRSSEKCFACGYCEKRKQSACNFLTYYQKL